MIYDNLKIFSQNKQKNSLIINTILETQSHFDIIFIQELPWSILHMIPSSISYEGEVLVGTSHYSNWLSFTRTSTNQLDSPRVLAYINIRLSSFWFSLCKDLINHKDILFISFFNNNIYSYIMNVYSNASHSVLKYLKDTEVNINNLLIMTGVMGCLNTNNFYFYFLLFPFIFLILYWFSFSFLFGQWRRHVTLQSHDMSHDVTS